MLNERPNTIDEANNVHHSTTRLPINISLDNRSMLTPTASGSRPKMVVVVVNRMGLRRCLQAFIITSSFERLGNSPVNLLKVSIRTMLLFTTIPDKATIAIAKVIKLNAKKFNIDILAGGGDTVLAINKANAEEGFNYISNAGGAFLEWLEGNESPGVNALRNNDIS